MAERIHPSAPRPPKPKPPTTTTRPPYCPHPPPRPIHHHRRRRSTRGCCCTVCLWLTFLLIALAFLSAIAAGVFYVLYHPDLPAFSLTALRNSSTSHFNLSVTARNPNRKLAFFYDPIRVSVSSDGVLIGEGWFPGFEQKAGNSTVVSGDVKEELRRKERFPVEIGMETKVGVGVGRTRTARGKVGIRVLCGGVQLSVRKGKEKKTGAGSTGAHCKLKVRLKVWKWYF